MSAAASLAATAFGGIAVLLWSGLALLTALMGRIPPLQLLALTFAIAGAAGLVAAYVRGVCVWSEAARHPRALALATCALAGYHFFYFLALRNAPPAAANLLNYLWPLLIVVFAGLAGGGVRVAHAVGGAIGFCGIALLLMSGDAQWSVAHAPGYAAAAACALIWSAYSVANRRFRDAPVDLVTVACLATALLGGVAHALFEETVTPGSGDWAVIVAMGLGPVGLAFYLWDHGTKHGRLALLGAISYAAPVLSTLWLVLAGTAQPSAALAFAALAVAAGAGLASLPAR